MRAGTTLTGRTLTFDAFFTYVYLPHVRARKKSWELDNRLAMSHISPFFGHRQLSEISLYEVERWLTQLREKGLSPATCNRILSMFKCVCDLAERFGYIRYGCSPCRAVKKLKVPVYKDRFLSIREGQKLMKHLRRINKPEARAIQLLLLTGARKSEILRARWENLDLPNRVLTVPVSKSGKPRRIYLSEAAVRIFRQLGKAAQGWIFPGQAPDKPIADLYYFWNKIRQQLGLSDVRLHDLRHSYASFLVAAGHTLYEAQQLLGHSEPRTTMRYAHFAQHTLVKAAGCVARILEKQEDPEARPQSRTKHAKSEAPAGDAACKPEALTNSQAISSQKKFQDKN